MHRIRHLQIEICPETQRLYRRRLTQDGRSELFEVKAWDVYTTVTSTVARMLAAMQTDERCDRPHCTVCTARERDVR